MDEQKYVRLDRGLADLVYKGLVAAALGILGYVANSFLERVRYLEEHAQQSERTNHRLELQMRTEFLSKQEFREQMNQLWSKR